LAEALKRGELYFVKHNADPPSVTVCLLTAYRWRVPGVRADMLHPCGHGTQLDQCAESLQVEGNAG